MAGSARHKEFAVIDVSEVEPLTFNLGGEEFECRKAVQGSELLEFVRNTATDDDAAAATAVIDFVRNSIIEEDRDRFSDLLESEEVIVPLDTLAEVGRWLLETYSGRPTQQPSPSSRGPRTTKSSSRAKAS